jgi:hypothetical protein
MKRATLLAMVLSTLSASCATTSEPTPSKAASEVSTGLDDAIARFEPQAQGRETLRLDAAPPRALATTHTIAASPRAPRARSGRRVDVNLHHAPLENALGLLASECRLDFVSAGKLDTTVSLTLHRIDPCEALDVVAEAHGVELQRRGRIVIAKGR